MKVTHLQHHPRLGYAMPGKLRPLPPELGLPHECSNLVSFRKHAERKPDEVVKRLHAAQRPLSLYGEGSYCFYGIQSDSPLASLLLWDAAHFLNVGEKITLIEDAPVEFYLDREYFTGALEVVSRAPESVTYRKVSKLAAESTDDLDGWTFGIPVGPEDATILNAVVKRILEIDLPHKEIILCGRPGSNFSYFDQVRIVGEDITAPPVQICKKKNRLALEARYSNLVILHDRVFLPKHFGEMVRRFGPRYPMMTLQSMFFDNRVSLHPRRYSDYGMAMGEIAQGLQGLHRTSGSAVAIAPAIFTEIERTGFCFASAMRCNQDVSYATGSLYICRKDVWNAYPLDESLYWIEYEDIEQGLRMSKAGVPCRINPFGISQSVTSRALLSSPSPVESLSGKFELTGPRYLSVLDKKPMFKLSTEVALKKLHQFLRKYAPAPERINIPTGQLEVGARRWVQLINSVVQQARFKNDMGEVREFVSDFERLVLLDQLPASRHELLVRGFYFSPVETQKTLVIDSPEIRNMLRQRPLQTWFCRDATDFFHHKLLSLPGILISAIQVYRRNGKVFYFESFAAALRSIYNSTPFRSYTELSQ